MPAPTFSERLVTRQRLWWESRGDALHRVRERRSRRHRSDPDEVWRCCRHWQRSLVNKWNAREYAARFGCTLPELYWSGSDHSAAPLDALPARFVIRPLHGANREGVAVVVDGRELLSGTPAPRAELQSRLPRSRRLRRPLPVLIEEFVQTGASAVAPLEVKCHAFGEHVAALQFLERHSPGVVRQRYYTPAWEPFPEPMQLHPEEDAVREPPPGVAEMVRLATAIGRSLGTYMRVDFFATEHGPVFNEFSSVPLRGKHGTPYRDRHFGDLWAELIPERT